MGMKCWPLSKQDDKFVLKNITNLLFLYTGEKNKYYIHKFQYTPEIPFIPVLKERIYE